MDQSDPACEFSIHPEGPVLARILDAITAPPARGDASPASVRAAGRSVTFQFNPEALRRARDLLPGEDWPIAWIGGPYCRACRAAITATSFSEWTTAEEREAALPAACPACRVPLAEAGRDTGALRRAAVRALRRAAAAG